MAPVVVFASILAFAAPLAPVSKSPSKIAAPAPTTGGAAAEQPADTRTSAPPKMDTVVRSLLPRLGEELQVTPTEQVLLDDVVASVRAGDDAKADTAWTSLVTANHERTHATDIDALVLYVLRASYLDQHEDLRAYADKIAFFNAQKKAIRDHIKGVRAGLAAATPGTHSITLPTVVIAKKRKPGKKPVAPGKSKTLTAAEWEAYAAKLDEQMQTIGEEAQLATLDLQDALNEHQQTLKSVSAVIKKYNDAAKAVISNLRG